MFEMNFRSFSENFRRPVIEITDSKKRICSIIVFHLKSQSSSLKHQNQGWFGKLQFNNNETFGMKFVNKLSRIFFSLYK